MTSEKFLGRYGNMDACIKHLERSRRELLKFINALSDEQLWAQRDPQTWSPAEVSEHISLVEESGGKIIRRLRKVIQGQAAPFPSPPPGKTRPDGRPIAPDPAQPKGGLTRAELLERLTGIRQRLLEEVEEGQDLLEHPTTYKHPFFGQLNALGWLQTLVYHERHHLKQIQDRVSAVSNEP